MELFVINSVTSITDCEYIKIVYEPMTSAIPIALRDFDCVTIESALSLPPPFESSLIFLRPSPPSPSPHWQLLGIQFLESPSHNTAVK